MHLAISTLRRLERPCFGPEDLIERIRGSVIGDDIVVDGPFGPRRMVYADATASGRSLSFIEELIREHVLPMYGNTHTEASATGRRTTGLREEARRIIHQAVNGGDDDVVIFCGTGATGAIDKLSRLLALDPWDRPVVFVGPYEHHSNELPWRESVADLVTIQLDGTGGVDLVHLEHELRRHADRTVKIGSFSAASNVTGVVTDVDRITITLHRHGALACWDYAAAGPYLPIDVNAAPDVPDGVLAYKDAVFISPHKFVGGPGTPGILVAKRSMFRNRVPSVPGGGTVLFVSPSGHAYHPDPEAREEGGTPGIVESIRAGLVFALKDQVGVEEIRRREHAFARRALASWRTNPHIEILGSTQIERLPIISFGMRHAGRQLHANFVVALLSDLFGIQARSGCFCAGPYLHRLYGIDDELSARMQTEALNGHMGAMLGFTRISFNYFISETTFAYILDAVHLVAEHGWKLLPLYCFDPVSGLWRHRDAGAAAEPGLSEMLAAMPGRLPTAPESALAGQLSTARDIIAALEAHPPVELTPSQGVGEEFERIRWFPMPAEALTRLHAGQPKERS
ncbi:MAG TPA: aminotransferase class V-fold PLP-dependent enzyme [Solirubrobacteraceae bacterium]|nr:aminotransferase class V-fold PLP-dependent enzyme [Solirubrobacteraceae bacterium]